MSYKKLGNYIKLIDNRNKHLSDAPLLGVSVQKRFIISIANTIGSDMSKYKLIEKNNFVYIADTSRRGDKIGIALLKDYDKALISQAYTSFKIIDENELSPDYLMMWFSRPEFDRYSRYHSIGSVREVFDWKDMCEVELPIPTIEEQQQIVAQYQSIAHKIKVNEQICEKLEAAAQALYKHWFVDFEFPVQSHCEERRTSDEAIPSLGYKSSGGTMVWNEELGKEIPEGWKVKSLEAITKLITDGKHGNSDDEFQSGYYFISAKDILNEMIDYSIARQITYKDFKETHKRTDLKTGDILITNSGTIGKIAYVFEDKLNSKTTFQKSVAILKPTIDSQFFFQAIKNNIRELIELAGGSTQSNLLLGDLKTFKILVPLNNVITYYSNKNNLIIKESYLLKKQNQKLRQLQSLLLSLLAVGEEVNA